MSTEKDMRDTSRFTNVVSQTIPPVDERVFWPEYIVKHYTDTDPQIIEDGINDLSAFFAQPLMPDTRYTFRDIQYTSAQTANNVIEYSALVSYVKWHAV